MPFLATLRSVLGAFLPKPTSIGITSSSRIAVLMDRRRLRTGSPQPIPAFGSKTMRHPYRELLRALPFRIRWVQRGQAGVIGCYH